MMSTRTVCVGAKQERPLDWLVWDKTESKHPQIAKIVRDLEARELPPGSSLERIDEALRDVARAAISTTVQRQEVLDYRKVLERRDRAIVDIEAGASTLRSLSGTDAFVQLDAILERLDEVLELIDADPYLPFDPKDRSLVHKHGHPSEPWTQTDLIALGVYKTEARVLRAFIRARAKRRSGK